MKAESPVVEKHGAYDTLHNVVGQAHATVRYHFVKYVLEMAAVVGKDDARYQNEHECKLV